MIGLAVGSADCNEMRPLLCGLSRIGPNMIAGPYPSPSPQEGRGLEDQLKVGKRQFWTAAHEAVCPADR
jgi:hypothetical protein